MLEIPPMWLNFIDLFPLFFLRNEVKRESPCECQRKKFSLLHIAAELLNVGLHHITSKDFPTSASWYQANDLTYPKGGLLM